MLIINSILIGIGLSMDAFSISVANALNDLKMNKAKMFLIAGIFAFFQFMMPLIGWTCVHTIVNAFRQIEKYIPIIAFILLLYIGGKMVYEGIKEELSKNNNINRDADLSESKNIDENINKKIVNFSFFTLILQAIATSIDALSVGFTIENYNFASAMIASIIIGIVTFILCMVGLIAGKTIGLKFNLTNKFSILGGAILIIIGVKILIESLI